ncbi:MAG: hypothetical protein ACK559_15135, partial [bacterium]
MRAGRARACVMWSSLLSRNAFCTWWLVVRVPSRSRPLARPGQHGLHLGGRGAAWPPAAALPRPHPAPWCLV